MFVERTVVSFLLAPMVRRSVWRKRIVVVAKWFIVVTTMLSALFSKNVVAASFCSIFAFSMAYEEFLPKF